MKKVLVHVACVIVWALVISITIGLLYLTLFQPELPLTESPAKVHRDFALYKAQLADAVDRAGFHDTHQGEPAFWLANAEFWEEQHLREQKLRANLPTEVIR